MHLRRDLSVLLFALREGDIRLAELIARALRREAGEPCAAGAPAAIASSTRAAPSPLARRTLDALVVMLGLDDPPRD